MRLRIELQRSLGRRDSRLSRINGDRLSQCACGSFEARFRDVVTVLPVLQHKVKIHQRVCGNGFPKNRDQLRIKFTDLFSGEFDSKHKRHATTEINGSRHECFFHRKRNAAVSSEAFFITECFGECLAKTDARVFDRVVMIDVQIALRDYSEVDQRVLCQQRQHVVKEADSRVDLSLSGAVQIEREVDGRFGRLSMNTGRARHVKNFFIRG